MFFYIRDVSYDPGPDFLVEADDKLGAAAKLEAYHTNNDKPYDVSWFTLTLEIGNTSYIRAKDSEVIVLR